MFAAASPATDARAGKPEVADTPPVPGSDGAAARAGRGVTRRLFDRLLLIASLAILLGWAWQGVYKVAPGESAVILRLGAHHYTRHEEGYWAHLPPPLESHVLVGTGQMRTETFGENPTRSTPGEPVDVEEKQVAQGITREAIQTADHNVVNVTYQLQYKIADAYAWAFSLADPASVLHDAMEASMRSAIGRRTIDEVMSQKWKLVEDDAARLLTERLDAYSAALGLGPAFEVQRVNLEKPQAPEPVREAFVDVVSAGQDEKRATFAATGDAVEIVERARSEAAEIRERAEAYKSAKIVEARGEAARFDALLVEYRAAPEVTRRRLYLETMEAILPGMDKVIGEPGAVNLWSGWPLPSPQSPPSPKTTDAAASKEGGR